MNRVIPGGLLGNIPVLFLVELGILEMEWESTENEPGMTEENLENLTTPIFLVHSWSIPGPFLVHSWDSRNSLQIPQESTRNWWGECKELKPSVMDGCGVLLKQGIHECGHIVLLSSEDSEVNGQFSDQLVVGSCSSWPFA